MSDIANAIVEQGLEAGYPPEKIADALNKFRMDIHAGVEKEWAHPETIWNEKDRMDSELQTSMDVLRSRVFQDSISKSLGSDKAVAAFRAKLGTDAKLDESEQNAFDGAQKIISDAKFNLGSDVIRDRYNIGQNRLFDYEMRAAPNGELQARVRFGKRGETADITLPDVTDGDVKAMAEGRRKDAANALASAEKEAKKLSGLIDATENLYDIRNIRESAAAKAAELNKEADVLESPVGMEFARKSKLFDELRKPEYRHQIGGSDLKDYADSLLKGVAQQGLGIATTATMPFSEEKARSIRDLSRNIGETAGAYGVEFSGSGLEKGFANSAESVGNMAPAIITGAMGAGEVAAIASLAPGTFGQQYNDTLNRADQYEKQGNAAMAKTLRDRAVVKAFVDTGIELGSEGLFPLFSKLGQGGIVGAGKRIIQENAEEIAGLAAKNIISDPITGEKTGYGDIPETIRDTTGATALMELGGMAANKFAGQRVQAQSARANAPSLETGESIVPPVPAAPEAPPVIAAEVIEPEILPPPTPPMSEGAAVEVGGMREAPPMQEVPPTPAAAPPPPQTEAPPPPPPSFTATQPDTQSDEKIVAEPVRSIIDRTATGPERDEAIAKRREAAVRIAATLKKGDKVIEDGGEEFIIEGVLPNGKAFVEGYGEPVDIAALLVHQEVNDVNGNKVQINPATIVRKSEKAAQDQPEAPPPSFVAAAGIAATLGGTEAAKHVAAAQAIVDGVVPPAPKPKTEDLQSEAIGVVYDLRSPETGESMDLDSIEMGIENIRRKLAKGVPIDWARETTFMPNTPTASVPTLKSLLSSEEGIQAIQSAVDRARKSEAAPAANDITARAAPAPVVSPSATGTTPKEAGGVTGDTRSLSEPLPNIPAEAAPPVNAESEAPRFNVPPPSNQGAVIPPQPTNPARPASQPTGPTLDDAKKVVADLQNPKTGNPVRGVALNEIEQQLDIRDAAEDVGGNPAPTALQFNVSPENEKVFSALLSSPDGRIFMRAAIEQAREQQTISPATTAAENQTPTGSNTTDENAIRSQEGRQGQGRQEGLLNSPAATSAQTVAENAPSAQESEKNTERYWTIDDLDVLSKEGPAKKRGTFPRFLVKVDDKTTAIKTPQALAKFLSSVRSHFPRVFKNTGKGVTIDFDISRKESDAAFDERATQAKPERRGGRKLPKIIKTLNGPTGDKTQPHVLDYLYRNPIPLPPESVRKESGEWDWLGKGENKTIQPYWFWKNLIFKETNAPTGRDVTSAIDGLKEAGYFPGIANPTPEDLGRLIQTGVAEWDKARSTKGAPTEEEQRESTAEQQRIDFEKATESGPVRLDPNALAKGDKIIIEGEQVTVTGVEFDEDGRTTSFTIRDGTKFGVQTVDGEHAVYVDDYQPTERGAGEFVPEDLQATKRSKAPTKEGEQTDMFAGKPDEPFNLFSETKEEREAREKEEDKARKKKEDEERERARIEAEKAQMGFDLGEENNGAPGAAAASEFKESTAGKYWRDDFVRAARAQPLIYRISPGKELEELADDFVKKGDLPTITNDLLTKTNSDLGFTEREYGYLIGSAMLEWEGKIIEAESYGADDTIVDPMRANAAALFEKYQDLYNRAGSVLQSAGHLERRDPLMRLRASFQKAEEARGKKTEEAAVKATGTTPDELGKEIKTNADAEIKKQAETKTAEVEKTPAAKTAVQQAKDAIKKKVDAIRRKLTGKNESAARAKSIKEAESKLANFRSKLEKDGAAGVANAFFRDDPLPAKPGPLVQSSDDLRSELSGLLNEALDKLGIERVSEKRTPEEEYKRIVATLGLDDLRLGKMNEIDKLVNERIDKIAENDPDRAEALLERWEQVSAAMIDNGVSGSTMRRVINLTLAEKGVSVGELSRMLPTDREKMIDEVAQTIRERVQKAGTPESAGTTAAALRNVHDITKSTVKEMLQSHAENQKTARTRTTSPTTKAQLASANLAERFSDTPPSLAPKAKPEDAMREMIKRAIAEGVPENFAKQLQDMGVSESAAVSLTNSVTNARNQAVKVAVEKARQAFLDRFKPRAKRPSPEHVDKLVKMVMDGQVHGVLGTREFADAIAKTMGVEPNRMNPAKIKELERTAVKARSLPVGSTERMDLEQDIQDELRLHAGLSTMDLIRAGWYQNILNAFGTQAVNIKGDIAQMTGALYQALGDALVGDPRAFGRLLSAWGRSLKPSVGGFIRTLQTGRAHKGGFKYGDTSASELAAKGWDKLPAHQKAIYHGMLQGVQKYGMRFMSGVDVMFNQMAREAGAALAAGRAVRERGLKPGTQSFNVEFAKEMGLDGGKYLIAMQEAQKELRASGKNVSLLEMQRRALEKVNRSRSESNQDASLRFSDRSTYQFDPEGTGYYISAMIDLLHRVPVIGRAAQAFNRIIANVVYENLDYTGLGLIRGALGTPITEMRGDKKGGKFLAPKKQVIYDSGERRERALKGATGITLGASLWAIANAFKDRPDDDKMPLMFYGYGPKGKKERAVWLKAGNRPYSYRIGSRVVPYQESQMAYPLAIVGAFMDRQRYGDDDDNTVSAMAALGDAARSIFYFGPLSNIKKLVDSVDAEGGGLANGIADVAANAARGLIPFSSALREAESIISPEMTNTKTKGLAGVAHKVMSGIPEASQFAPVALDVFGKPQVVSGLPGVRRIIGTSQPTEDLTRWLLANKAYPNMPPIIHEWAPGEPIAKKGAEPLDPANMEAKSFDLARISALYLTPEEQMVFLKARGAAIETGLRNVMENFDKKVMPPESQKALAKMLQSTADDSLNSTAKMAGIKAVIEMHR